MRLAGGLARALRGATPSWSLLERERLSRVLVVSDSDGDRGRDRGRSLENLGDRGRDGEVGRVLERKGDRGRPEVERGKSLDREGEWGRRGEEGSGSLDLGSLTTGESGRSLGRQTLYLRGGRKPEKDVLELQRCDVEDTVKDRLSTTLIY